MGCAGLLNPRLARGQGADARHGESGTAIDDLAADGAAYAKLIKTCQDGAKAMAKQIQKAKP